MLADIGTSHWLPSRRLQFIGSTMCSKRLHAVPRVLRQRSGRNPPRVSHRRLQDVGGWPSPPSKQPLLVDILNSRASQFIVLIMRRPLGGYLSECTMSTRLPHKSVLANTATGIFFEGKHTSSEEEALHTTLPSSTTKDPKPRAAKISTLNS